MMMQAHTSSNDDETDLLHVGGGDGGGGVVGIPRSSSSWSHHSSAASSSSVSSGGPLHHRAAARPPQQQQQQHHQQHYQHQQRSRHHPPLHGQTGVSGTAGGGGGRQRSDDAEYDDELSSVASRTSHASSSAARSRASSRISYARGDAPAAAAGPPPQSLLDLDPPSPATDDENDENDLLPADDDDPSLETTVQVTGRARRTELYRRSYARTTVSEGYSALSSSASDWGGGRSNRGTDMVKRIFRAASSSRRGGGGGRGWSVSSDDAAISYDYYENNGAGHNSNNGSNEGRGNDRNGNVADDTASAFARTAPLAGYLSKLGTSIPTYKRRFFVLKPTTYLYYFMSADDTEPRGCIDLDGGWNGHTVGSGGSGLEGDDGWNYGGLLNDDDATNTGSNFNVRVVDELSDGRVRFEIVVLGGGGGGSGQEERRRRIVLEARSRDVADRWMHALHTQRLSHSHAQLIQLRHDGNRMRSDLSSRIEALEGELVPLREEVDLRRRERDGALNDAGGVRDRMGLLEEGIRLLIRIGGRAPHAGGNGEEEEEENAPGKEEGGVKDGVDGKGKDASPCGEEKLGRDDSVWSKNDDDGHHDKDDDDNDNGDDDEARLQSLCATLSAPPSSSSSAPSSTTTNSANTTNDNTNTNNKSPPRHHQPSSLPSLYNVISQLRSNLRQTAVELDHAERDAAARVAESNGIAEEAVLAMERVEEERDRLKRELREEREEAERERVEARRETERLKGEFEARMAEVREDAERRAEDRVKAVEEKCAAQIDQAEERTAVAQTEAQDLEDKLAALTNVHREVTERLSQTQAMAGKLHEENGSLRDLSARRRRENKVLVREVKSLRAAAEAGAGGGAAEAEAEVVGPTNCAAGGNNNEEATRLIAELEGHVATTLRLHERLQLVVAASSPSSASASAEKSAEESSPPSVGLGEEEEEEESSGAAATGSDGAGADQRAEDDGDGDGDGDGHGGGQVEGRAPSRSSSNVTVKMGNVSTSAIGGHETTATSTTEGGDAGRDGGDNVEGDDGCGCDEPSSSSSPSSYGPTPASSAATRVEDAEYCGSSPSADALDDTLSPLAPMKLSLLDVLSIDGDEDDDSVDLLGPAADDDLLEEEEEEEDSVRRECDAAADACAIPSGDKAKFGTVPDTVGRAISMDGGHAKNGTRAGGGRSDATIMPPPPRLSAASSQSESTSSVKSSTTTTTTATAAVTVTETGSATSRLTCPLTDVTPSSSANVGRRNVGRIYHLTFHSAKIGLQFQRVPAAQVERGVLAGAMTSDFGPNDDGPVDGGDGVGLGGKWDDDTSGGGPNGGVVPQSSSSEAELERIAEIARRARDRRTEGAGGVDRPSSSSAGGGYPDGEAHSPCRVAMPVDAVLVCGFRGFDDGAGETGGHHRSSRRPELGARLVAFDGISVEIGMWTFDRVRRAIQSRDRPLTLSFRNDYLTTEQRAILTRAVAEADGPSLPLPPVPPSLRPVPQARIRTNPSWGSDASDGRSSVRSAGGKREELSSGSVLPSPARSVGLQRGHRPLLRQYEHEHMPETTTEDTYTYESFSEAGNSSVFSSTLAPLMAGLMSGLGGAQVGDKVRDSGGPASAAAFAPQYLRGESGSLEAHRRHHEFTASLL